MAAPMFARRNFPSPAFLLIPVAILLAGCTSDRQQAKDDTAAAEEAAKQTGTIDDARCQSYGFQSGSPDYAQCRKDIDSGHKQMGVK
jgi:outer membrane biogenesis lipoprotein LolB